MRENVIISYRGASYEIGRGQGFYGIWPAGSAQEHPIEWWHETPEGWYGAWSRFTAVETPGTIVPVTPVAGRDSAASAGLAASAASAGLAAPGSFSADAVPAGPPGRRGVIAAALLALGVVCGIIGLFPGFLGGASLASETAELVPHVFYLAAWTAGAVLILLGGRRQQVGVLLAAGTSIVTFGFFFADAGTAIAGRGQLAGAGLVLGLIGWAICAVGSGLAFRLRVAGAPARPRGSATASLGTAGAVTAVLAIIAALGVAITFAPSWDRYTLRTLAGATQIVTAGNAFANPALVITGDVLVMIALVAVAVVAALWRPTRMGAVLLAGAVIPMAAQAISGFVQLGQTPPPSEFGISSAQAAQAGLTISSGGTAAFWVYCVLVLVLIATCARMLLPPLRPAAADRPAPAFSAPPAAPPAAPLAAGPSSPAPAQEMR